MALKRKMKPKKKLSGVKTCYRPWKDWDEDDIILGKYSGSTPNKMSEGKKDWIFEVESVFFADKKEQKRVQGEQYITLNTSGKLDKAMAKAEEGDDIQITYKGSKKMEGGKFQGKNAHDFEIELMEEDSGDDDIEDSDDEEDEDDL